MDRFTKQCLVVGSVWGVATLGVIILFQNKLSDTLKKHQAYKEVMEEVRKHRGAINFLGEPIKDKTCSFHRKAQEANQSKLKVDVVGPKSRGIVYFTTKKIDKKNVSVECIHLQIGNNKSELLVIK